MACQCLSGRTLTTIACNKLLTRRPLRLLTTARSQTEAGTTLKSHSVKSSHGDFLGSGNKLKPFTRANSQTVRQRHRILTQAYNQKPDIADRVVASVPYLIPLIDGLRYGNGSCGAIFWTHADLSCAVCALQANSFLHSFLLLLGY